MENKLPSNTYNITVHELKTIDPYFREVKGGLKTFELRFNDRNFQVGDELLLKRFVLGEFTGEICHRTISYILKGVQFGLKDGYVILGLTNW